MADISKVAANIRPLNGAVVRRYNAGGALAAGDAVYIHSGGTVQGADADAVASAQARGIVVANPVGDVAFTSGMRVDVVVFGPVEGYASMTPGGAVFVSVNAGQMDQTAPASAGDFPFAIGYAESASSIFVNPQATVPVVNGG